ncbi:MAG TPA: 5'-3' exonuclease H3TH domain-containing protein [Verrucomicrobiae bacterium]
MTPRLLVVDGHAYAYRAFHAIRELKGPAGQPTNAIYGFIKMVAKLRGIVEPTHIVVVWDGGLSSERVAVLPEYKAQRPPMPAALEQQLDEIVAWLRASRVASWCRDGVEADDWIAALARWAEAEGWTVVIASSDKDFMQLVSERVGLVNPNDRSEAVWTAEQVREKTGVTPAQVVDWLSLMGDAVDNIPGVPGVGTKTAAELLGQFGTVDGLYARLPEVKSDRLRAALVAAERDVRRNRDLVRLKTELPAPVLADDLAMGAPDVEALGALYRRWGFRSLLAGLESVPDRQATLL